MKNNKTEDFFNKVQQFRQYGDAPRITKIVNDLRTQRGERDLAPSYIRAMLNGDRTLTPEVAEVAKKYYQMQELLNNISL